LQDEKQVSFDDYVETYKSEIQNSIGFIGQDVDFFIELKAKLLLKLAGKQFGDPGKLKALDIGSGIGLVDKILKHKIKDLHGVDIEEGVIEKAKINNPEVTYNKYDGMKLPFRDNMFDLAFAINVIHHVPPGEWENFSKEMHRVLKPGGIAVVFEHNPYNPLTRKVVRDCEFDRDAVLLKHSKIKDLFKSAGLQTIEDKYIIFFPFKSGIFRGIETVLGWLPLGAQQYVAGLKV
jgi:ubiquinone/menaquinone biosynthesis C-methylase UbiE